jgi:hypothetical protein
VDPQDQTCPNTPRDIRTHSGPTPEQPGAFQNKPRAVQNNPERYRAPGALQDQPGAFQNSSGSPWNWMEGHGMLWNILEHDGTEPYGKLWKVMESYGTSRNIMEHARRCKKLRISQQMEDDRSQKKE